jgi:hypothetical protein
MSCQSTFHRYVYRRSVDLARGVSYNFQTRNLRDVFWFQSAPADPVMYLVKPNSHEIVARNDDYNGLASEIFYTADSSQTYTLVIRARTTATPGYCDIFGRIAGGSFLRVDQDALFFGVRHSAQWNAEGQVFETTSSTGDPYLIFIIGDFAGGHMYFGPGVDDAGTGLNSKFVTPAPLGPGIASGMIVLGSYSRWTEGNCDLCTPDLDGAASRGPSRPDGSERGRHAESSRMRQFTDAMKEQKEHLESLEPWERDKRVAELRQTTLSEEERRLQTVPVPQAAPDLLRSYTDYFGRYSDLASDLKDLSYVERSQKLTELKERTVGP